MFFSISCIGFLNFSKLFDAAVMLTKRAFSEPFSIIVYYKFIYRYNKVVFMSNSFTVKVLLISPCCKCSIIRSDLFLLKQKTKFVYLVRVGFFTHNL